MQLLAWASGLLLGVAAVSANPDKPAVTELKIETTFTPEDCSVKAAANDQIKVNYRGTLYDTGVQFDSSYGRNPLPLTLGVGQVIQGWDQGLVGMCVGEKRTLTIPSSMAYGSRGAGNVIPPDAALVFETELVEMRKAGHKDEL